MVTKRRMGRDLRLSLASGSPSGPREALFAASTTTRSARLPGASVPMSSRPSAAAPVAVAKPPAPVRPVAERAKIEVPRPSTAAKATVVAEEAACTALGL